MPNTYISLEGGLNLEVPPIEAKPGQCIEAYNFYESVKGGYTTLKGYERYDGLPAPSEATYYYILIDDWDLVTPESVNIADGQTLVIGTLTVTILTTEVSPDGTQVIIIGGESVGAVPALPVAIGGSPSVIHVESYAAGETTWETGTKDTYLAAAQSVRRTAVSVVPGTGDIRGVAQVNSEVIAWRDSGSDVKAYKASASSWVEIPNAAIYEVDVTGDTVATVGDVCNSGNDKIVGVYEYLAATVPDANKRVYVVKRIAGGVPTSFINDVGAVDHGSVLGTVAWTPSAGGKVSYINHNFYAGLDTYNMYFADAVNVPMVYNVADDVIQPISADYRTLLEVCKHPIAHNQRLMLSTNGGTYLTSVVGEPTVMDGFLGAQEIGVGDDITGFAATSSELLAIYTRNQTHVVKGTSAETWEKRIASKNSGAKDGCIAQIDDVYSSDDRGISRLSRTEALGGFNAGTITDDIQSRFNVLGSQGQCSTTFRALNQLRFYYGANFLIASRIPYNANGNEGVRYGLSEGAYPVHVKVVSTEEDLTGIERTFFGSTDGYVYQMDVGSSFDGAAIEQSLSLHFNHLKSPLVRKRFVGVDFEAMVEGTCAFQVYYYMNDGNKSFEPRTVGFVGGNSQWDSALFNEALFDSIPLTRPRMTLRGTGFNLQFVFYRNSAFEPQGTLTGYALRYKQRGLVAI